MRDGRFNTTPEADRLAAELRADGLSYRRIAEALGISDKTAKQAAERGANSRQLDKEKAAAAELRKLLGRRWRRLTEAELAAAHGRQEGKTLEAIGRQLAISKQRVQQLLEQAERKLREDR